MVSRAPHPCLKTKNSRSATSQQSVMCNIHFQRAKYPFYISTYDDLRILSESSISKLSGSLSDEKINKFCFKNFCTKVTTIAILNSIDFGDR